MISSFRASTSTFPDHQFDFGDAVFIVALQRGGTVDGIRHRDGGWQYNLSCNAKWWDEDLLEPACPQCFRRWSGDTQCRHCGYISDD